MPKQKFIVAEISKNWRGRVPAVKSGLIQEQFEEVLRVNDGRGYGLLSFALHRLMTGPDELNETIIAVFQDKDQP